MSSEVDERNLKKSNEFNSIGTFLDKTNLRLKRRMMIKLQTF